MVAEIEMTLSTILTLSALLLLLISASIYPYVKFQLWCLFRSVVWAILQVVAGFKWTVLLALGLYLLQTLL